MYLFMLLRTWQSIVIALIINRRMQYDRLSQQQLGVLFSILCTVNKLSCNCHMLSVIYC